ncbi:hypothetical protein NPIL_6181, partial [Nephila pilipes]
RKTELESQSSSKLSTIMEMSGAGFLRTSLRISALAEH